MGGLRACVRKGVQGPDGVVGFFFFPFSLWRCGLAGMEYMSAGGTCFVLSLFLFLLITRHH